MLGQGETIKEFQPRFPVLLGVIGVVFLLLASRMFYLQIARGQFYRAFSESQSLRKEKLPGPRGQIFDRNNRLLVDNRLQLDVTVTPQYLKDPKTVMDRLAVIAGEDPVRLLERYRQKALGVFKFQPISIIENAPWNVVVQIESANVGQSGNNDLAGVEVEPRIRRTYLNEKIGAHLFGYLSEVTKNEIEQRVKAGKAANYELGDWIGRSGLERFWEKELRGQDGVRFVEVDAHGHRISSGDKTLLHDLPGDIEPTPGTNLVLTVDEDLQLAAAEAMKGKMGAAVALDPRTGEVLAMISNPGFDPTEMASKGPELWTSIVKNPYEPLRNKAIQDHYPAGSTFKIFTSIAALDAGVINENTTVFCPGYFKFGSRIFNCHKRDGHGSVNLHGAIAGSCDVFFYQLAARIGIDVISNMAKKFGFGSKTGIELGSERTGLMPTEEWKMKTYNQPWSPGETLSAAIGQGANLITPLQLAVGYSTLVNGGNLYKPYVVARQEDLNGNVLEAYGPKLVSNVKINPAHLETIKQALFDVANSPKGTAYHYLHTDDGLISGKSGTAQVMSFSRDELFKPCANLPFEKRHHAWFVGYAPRDNPEIVVAVLGLHECAGGRVAGPVVKAIIEKFWGKKKAQEQLIAGPQQAPDPATAAKLARDKARVAGVTRPSPKPRPSPVPSEREEEIARNPETGSEDAAPAALPPPPAEPIPLGD